MNQIEHLEQFIVETLTTKLKLKPGQIGRSNCFHDDLALSSLGAVEVVMEIEAEFGIDIPDEDTEQLVTVGDLIDDVAARVRKPDRQ